MEHVRIDEGVKRGKKLKPNQIETITRNKAGKFMSQYTPELKAKAIEQGLIALECGVRIEEIADKLKIPRATMYTWMLTSSADQARTAFFDGQCFAALADVGVAQTPIDLTRAREFLAGWVKIAERRDPKSWAQKQEVRVEVVGDLQARLAEARNRIIDITPDTAPQQLTDDTQSDTHTIDNSLISIEQKS